MKLKLLSRIWLLATPWTAAHQAPPSLGFSRREDWSGAPSPSPVCHHYWSLNSESRRAPAPASCPPRHPMAQSPSMGWGAAGWRLCGGPGRSSSGTRIARGTGFPVQRLGWRHNPKKGNAKECSIFIYIFYNFCDFAFFLILYFWECNLYFRFLIFDF